MGPPVSMANIPISNFAMLVLGRAISACAQHFNALHSMEAGQAYAALASKTQTYSGCSNRSCSDQRSGKLRAILDAVQDAGAVPSAMAVITFGER